MSYEMYEVVKQYNFEIHGFGQVKADIIKCIKPELNAPYMWRTNYMHDGYAPNHGLSFQNAETELLYYIEHFDAKSAQLDPNF